MQASSSSLINCVDHIMIRVNDAIYDQVFSLFAETLQLPVAWDVHNFYPPFKAGGIDAGNINMEIFRSGEQPLYPSQAQIYGICLETAPLSESLPELTRRGIPHLPPYAYHMELSAAGASFIRSSTWGSYWAAILRNSSTPIRSDWEP